MAKVRYIKHTADRLSLEDKLQIMTFNLRQYIKDANAEGTNKKMETCCNCAELTRRGGCKIIGSCPSGRKDFYKQHINRKKGACPKGKW
ncbi:hypothetical protein CMK18_23940 [Candidatus Poribacteria bacterium]|nr:hypothetical protein [Candidatus Poribacteria bacterium]